MPSSNSPVTNVAGKDFVCNTGGSKGVSGKCPVAAGSTVTVEMHQVPLSLLHHLPQANPRPSNPTTGNAPPKPSAGCTGVPSKAGWPR